MVGIQDSVRRAARTFFQAFVGVLVASGVLSALEEGGVVDWSGLKKVGISAAAAGVVAVFSFLQNYLEDEAVIPVVIPK